MTDSDNATLNKVPAVTLGFWIIKIVATTLGETAGDAVSMSLNLGYAISSVIFIGLFVAAVAGQISAKSFHAFLYWAVIVATTTAGTTMADFADRSLGIGYAGGSSILFALLMLTLYVWYRSTGSISVHTVASPKVEMFYWGAILFSQTLGTALGDWMADTNGFGYERGALVFAAGLVVVAAAYFLTNVSRTLLFWSAFILTRPLGATLGDLLDKPIDHGGLAFSRFTASAVLAALMIAGILLFPREAGRHPGEEEPGGEPARRTSRRRPAGEGHDLGGVDRQAALLGRLADGGPSGGRLVALVVGTAILRVDAAAREHPHPPEGHRRGAVEHQHLEPPTVRAGLGRVPHDHSIEPGIRLDTHLPGVPQRREGGQRRPALA